MIHHSSLLALVLAVAMSASTQNAVSTESLYVAAPAEYQVWEFAVNRIQEAERALIDAAPRQYGLWIAASTSVYMATVRLRSQAPEELDRFLKGPTSEVTDALAELREVAGPALVAWEEANEAKTQAEEVLTRVAPDQWEEYTLSRKVLHAAAAALASAAPNEWAGFLADVSVPR